MEAEPGRGGDHPKSRAHPQASTSSCCSRLRRSLRSPPRDEWGAAVSLEIVLLVPVLVLLTLFVLWAGRGGRAELTADLAAEEAAVAASVCCEEGTGGEPAREQVVEEVLRSRPGLDYLCVGGLRGAARDGSGRFVDEEWVDFSGADSAAGGVGVLGVRFLCESDGAVAPMRGLFPTVTFFGEASEVVIQNPGAPGIGFSATRFSADEDAGPLEFKLGISPALTQGIRLHYTLRHVTTEFDDFTPQLPQPPPPGYVDIPAGVTDETIQFGIADDSLYEGDEELEVTLSHLEYSADGGVTWQPLPPTVATLNVDTMATGTIVEDDEKPHVFLHYPSGGPCAAREGHRTPAFEVRLRDQGNTGPAHSAVPVAVDFSTDDDTATAPGDYTSAPTTVNFAPGEDTKPVQGIITIDDPDGELDETFTVELRNPQNAPLGSQASITCTIEDDEVRISVERGSAAREDGSLVFQVELDRDPDGPIDLEYTVGIHNTGTFFKAKPGPTCDENDPAYVADTDFVGIATGQATIPDTQNPAVPFPLPGVVICDDLLAEADETLWVEVKVVSGEATMAQGRNGAYGTIRDNDGVEIRVDDRTGTEGDTITFDVSLIDVTTATPATLQILVELSYEIVPTPATTDVDAAVCDDFTVPAIAGYCAATPVRTGILAFGSGATTAQPIEVRLEDDYLPEGDETFLLKLEYTGSALAIADAEATGTIENRPTPKLSVNDFTGHEGDSRAFTVTLSDRRPGETVTVDYTIAGTTASGPGTAYPDFEMVPPDTLTGTLTFSGTTVTHDIDVRLLHDAIAEAPEMLQIRLENPMRAILDDPIGVGTIRNVNPPEVVVSDAAADEGDKLTFTVELKRPRAGETVLVDYEVVARSARAGSDFVDPPDGQLRLNRANPTATVMVDTLVDKITENPETLLLALTLCDSDASPTDACHHTAALGDPYGVGTINNVNLPVIRVVDAPTVVEGQALQFKIVVVDDMGNPVSVRDDIDVLSEISDGTATGGGARACTRQRNRPDYQRPAGKTTHSFTTRARGGGTISYVYVTTCTDTEAESTETVQIELELADPTALGAVLGDNQGVGAIRDAPPPRLRVEDATADEGESLTFTVTLSRVTSDEVTVDWKTEDGTATEPGDYTSGSGTLTFQAGTTTQTFTVDALADGIFEFPHETMRVVLSAPSGALLDRAIAVGTIEEKCVDQTDPTQTPPALTIADARVPEGTDLNYIVSISQPMCQGFDLGFMRKAPSGANAASFLDDIVGGSGRETISTGLYRPVHTIRGPSILADGIDEDDEIFFVEVNWGNTMPSHYQGLAPATATITIVDGDPPPTVTVSDGDAEAGQPVGFEVRLSTASAKTVTVAYATADATADAGDDYTAVSGTLTFAPGDTDRQVQVATAPNSAGEPDETFRLNLSMPDNALLGDGVGVGTIRTGTLPVLRIADARAAEADGVMEFTVSLSEASAKEVSIEYATVELAAGSGAATEGDDYEAASGALTIPAGDTSATISVMITDDSEAEFDETFLVDLANPVNASLGDPSAVGTITGDRTCVDRTDPDATPPTLAFDPADLSAGEDVGVWKIGFTLSEPYCQSATFTISRRVGSTATFNSDFLYQSTRFALPRHQASGSIEVVVVDDLLIEDDETVVFGVHNTWYPRTEEGTHIEKRTQTIGTGTIVDNDRGSAQVSVEDASVAEGGTIGFTVRLERTAPGPVTIDYTTTDDTATAGGDYTARSGTLTIPAGELSAVVLVLTLEDDLDEDDETFGLKLSNALFAGEALSFATGGDTARGTITDDDPLPNASIGNTTAAEGDPLVFTVSLDEPSGREATVKYRTVAGTATPGDDYTAASGTLTFSAGTTSQTVEVQSTADAVLESTEQFTVLLSAPVNALLDDSTGVGAISDATQRALRVSDAVATEGGVLRFEVNFDGAGEVTANEPVTVRYRTVAGTAAPGDDYAAAAGTATIATGQSSAVVTVATVHDSLDEANERLSLEISDPTGAVVAVDRAVGLIIDDDPPPTLTVDDPEANENGDGTPLVFTVALSEPSGQEVRVDYATADMTAVAGDDYTAVSATLTIPAGDTAAAIDVELVDDATAESPETLRLSLSGPSNALLGDSIGVGTIFDDDENPQIFAIDAPAVLEAAGASSSFEVRLSRAAAADVTVQYATADGTAAAGDDYTAVSGTLTIPAGDTAATVQVALIDDTEVESAETFKLVLSNPSSNAALDPAKDEATAVIHDNESLPVLSVLDDPDATEGASAGFELRLNRPSAQAVTVEYRAVADPTGGSRAAAAGQDFSPVAGTATIAARSTTATVSVPLPDDALDEHDETFWLRLANPAGAALGDATAVGTIVDNDPAPRLSITDASVTEGGILNFAVRLAPVSGRQVTVPWRTAKHSVNNAATPGADYSAANGALTFTPGATRAEVQVTTVSDDIDEPDETLLVEMGQPVNAVVDDGVAVGAIVDDDGEPRISIRNAAGSEGDSPLAFEVRLSRPSSQTVSVDYTINDGTATRPDDFDYFEQSRTLVLAAGTTEGEISVYIVDDSVDEGDETFSVVISNPRHAVIAEGQDTAIGTILDNEGAEVSIADATAVEGDGKIEFEVSLSATSTDDVTVVYTTFDGSATQPDDYIAASGTLTIPAGDRAAKISVDLVNDPYPEDQSPESFLVRLSNPTGAALGKADAAGVIDDDDELPELRITKPRREREDVGTVPVEVRLAPASNRVVTVDYEITRTNPAPPSCASLGGASTGTLTFQPGDTAKNIPITIIGKVGQVCENKNFGRSIFLIRLRNPENAQFSDNYRDQQGRPYTRDEIIFADVDFDPDVTFSIHEHSLYGSSQNITVSEKVGEAVVWVNLLFESKQDVNIGWYFARGGSYAIPEAGKDYIGHPPAYTHSVTTPAGVLTIPAGERSQSIRITIIDDTDPELTEQLAPCIFSYTIDDGTINGREPRIASRIATDTPTVGFPRGTRCAFITIEDDDQPIEVSAADASASEAAGKVAVLVELGRIPTSDLTVDWATADDTATAPGDYTHASGTVEFKAGETVKPVEVDIVDDGSEETDETFKVVLSNPSSGAEIAADSGEAKVTIVDDDGADSLPVVTFYDTSGLESDALTGPVVRFGVSKRLTKQATIRYKPVFAPWLGNEAADSGDVSSSLPKGYFGQDGVSWPPSSFDLNDIRASDLQQLIVLDNVPEHDERLMIMAFDETDIAVGRRLFWVTIIDDDVPEVTVGDQTAAEDGGALVFTLELHAPAVETGTVDYEVMVLNSAGPAAAVPGQDYTPVSGTVTFGPGDTEKQVRVPVPDDNADEVDKQFLLLLKNPKVLVLADASAVGIIEDDDDGWIIGDRRLLENAGPMVFTVTRDHTSAAAVTVSYTVTGASAVGAAACADGVDFVAPSGSVTLAPADTQASISIALCDDSDTESAEAFQVELTGVPGRKLTATGTIVDND